MKRILCILLMIVLSIVILFTGSLLIAEINEDKTQENIYEELVEEVEKKDNSTDTTNFNYEAVAKLNSDYIAWIKIPDTNINYPVMQTKDRPNYYLHRNIYKNYSRYGTPYLQENCDITTSDNLVIYGHNMKTKAMFHDLVNYANFDYYQKHKNIQLIIEDKTFTYTIISAFKTVAYSNNGFDYYSFVIAKSENNFNDFVNECKELSFYDTGVSAECGDKLLTLSTCEYSRENGRMVVIAKLVEVK